MSKRPACSPECSTTMSRRKPVGGLLASAIRSSPQQPGTQVRAAQQRGHVEVAPGSIDGSGVEHDRDRNQLRLGGRLDQPALDSRSPVRDRARRHRAGRVDPVRVVAPPHRVELGDDPVGELVHVSSRIRVGPGEPRPSQNRDRTTGPPRDGRSCPETASRARQGPPYSATVRLDRAPDQRVDHDRDDRADARRPGLEHPDHRRVELRGGTAQRVEAGRVIAPA